MSASLANVGGASWWAFFFADGNVHHPSCPLPPLVRDPAAASNKENVTAENSTKSGASGEDKKPEKLSPSWLFAAALLDAPMDLSKLVTMSRDDPNAILNELGEAEGKRVPGPNQSHGRSETQRW